MLAGVVVAWEPLRSPFRSRERAMRMPMPGTRPDRAANAGWKGMVLAVGSEPGAAIRPPTKTTRPREALWLGTVRFFDRWLRARSRSNASRRP
jgi:hypothetical protein